MVYLLLFADEIEGLQPSRCAIDSDYTRARSSGRFCSSGGPHTWLDRSRCIAGPSAGFDDLAVVSIFVIRYRIVTKLRSTFIAGNEATGPQPVDSLGRNFSVFLESVN